MADPQAMQDITGHVFTVGASFALGVGMTELIAHLKDEYRLIRNWKFANISYFGARWAGLLTMSGYVALASIGHYASRSTCHGVFIFAHICCSLNSFFSASIFWTRCGALCHWRPIIIVPLALYGLGLSAYALASSASGFSPKAEDIDSAVCIVSMKSASQSISRFLFASFDLMVASFIFISLWGKAASGSKLCHLLIQDQLIYIAVTMTAYLGLASSFLMPSTTLQGFGLLCPSIISIVSCRLFLRLKRKGNRTSRIKAFPEAYQECQDIPFPPNSKSSLVGSNLENSKSSIANSNVEKSNDEKNIKSSQMKKASNQNLTSNPFSIQIGNEEHQTQDSSAGGSNQSRTPIHRQWRTRMKRSESEPPNSGEKEAPFTLPLHRSFGDNRSPQEGVELYQEVAIQRQ